MDGDFPLPPEGSTPIAAPIAAVAPTPVVAVQPIPAPPPDSMPLDVAPPPEGSVPLNDTVPTANPPPQATNLQTPGFWSSVGSAFGRGFTQNVADAAAGSRVLLPPGVGGKPLEDQFQEGLVHPETQDEITKLTKTGIYDGWSDPKWWGVNIAHGVGGMTPALGAGAIGAVAGPIGAIGGFASESALSSLVPAYKAARAAGLDPDAATHRALIDSGIAAAGAAAMGLAPGISMFGKVAVPGMEAAGEAAAQMFKRPVMEALAQMGLVQPMIGDAQHIVTSLTHGETPGTEDLLTNYALGVGMGAVPVGAHAAFRAITIRPIGAEAAPASPEVVDVAFKGQQTAPTGVAAPELSALEEPVYPREQKIFYSKLREVVDSHLPDNATPEQVIATLKNKGVKDEEILDNQLPGYLAGQNGRVSKADLQAHLESNGLVLEEARGGTPLNDYDLIKRTMEGQITDLGIDRPPEHPGQILPGEHSNYREFVLKIPPRGSILTRDIEGRPILDAMSEKDYVNAHWPEDINPVSHFRVTDRTDRDGRNLLHVEEIQSDAHQEGRKVGYKDPNARSYEEIQAERRASTPRHEEIRQKYKDYGTDDFIRNPMEPKDKAFMDYWNGLSREWQASVGSEHKVPDLPFKTSWEELTVKRILRLAADEGYDGISWANGDQIGVRLATADQLRGNREFYDRKVTNLFGKWAKKLGAEVGTTKFYDQDAPNFHPTQEIRIRSLGLDPYKIKDVNNFVEVNPAFSDRVKMGFSLYEEGVKKKYSLSESISKGMPKELVEPGKIISKIMEQIGKDISISLPMKIFIRPTAATWRGNAKLKDGQYEIHANTRVLRTPEDLYATLSHEIGHIIYWDKYASAPLHVRLAVEESFKQFRAAMNGSDLTVGDLRRLRDNAVSEMTGSRNDPLGGGQYTNDLNLSDLTPNGRRYLLHFKEWFAEQVSKWATTSEKPLSRVDKFYADLGKTIRGILEKFNILRKTPATAEKVMQDWLDSLMKDTDTSVESKVKDQTALEGLKANQNALSSDGTPSVGATVQTASTLGGRNIIGNLPPSVGNAGRASAAHADRMNKFFEWMTSLPQIAELNKHIRGLQVYRDIVATMNVEKNNIMSAAWSTLRQWKDMKDPRQQIALGKFIEDYMNGLFKDPKDQSGTIRRPTKAEFSALVQKHKLSDAAVKVFDRVRGDFDNTLENYRQLLLADSNRIKDPSAQMAAKDSINRRVDALLERPYFPAMRFGKYTITVYDSAGNVRHFEQAETLRKQKKIADALSKSTDLLPGDRVRVGEVPKDATPLLGMPPGLLDLMADKLSLSSTQQQMLDQLRFDYAPSQSFRHQFKAKDLTPGYSTDFQRAYANFFFHGANHITRVKWVDALRDQIREVKEGSIDLNEANKRDQIANYMTQHLAMLVDPKPDFAALRGLMFHWYLGFNPASATLNLSQTALMTFPHLASKFGGLGIGDLRAVGALARASSELNNFYKKQTLVDLGKNAKGPEGAKARALSEAVKEGVISETQAHTLAAVSEGRNLLRAFGSKGEEAWAKFSEASSWMFEMTEQYNRRVAFRAAWDLSMRDPNNKYVSETVRDNPLQYKRLIDQGWSHQEAAAFTAAKHTTEATQFVYAPYSRPKFMWGRKGALFIFKSFTQNTLFNLYNNPAGAGRTILILGALGGMMGLPGAEDVNGILKSLAWRLFGKDFDVEDEARKFAVDVLHGVIGPDMLLHGMSTKGFGIPQVMNLLGAQVGLPKFFPTLDRHGSIGMGNILPFEPGKLFGPAKDVKTNELAQVQRASGAGFSLGFALYNFLTSNKPWSDLKGYEGVMPRAMNNLSHAYRYLREGQERNSAGNSVVKFDPNDTEQMGEILGRALGYQPRRLIGAYEAIQAKQEAATYWDLRKGILLRQFGSALKGQDPEEKSRVLQSIRNYNQMLPEEAKAKSITSQVLRDSVMAKVRNSAKQEAGLPTAKQNYSLFKSLDKYYPDGRPTGLVGIQPVK